MILKIGAVDYTVEIYGEGEPLVLLHGFTGDSSTWSSYIPIWSKLYKVITIDIIGHGSTSSPDNSQLYSMFEVAKHLNEVLKQLKVNKTHLLGYSMGGRLALAFYMTYPEMVDSLILESASPGLETEEERTQRRIQDQELGDYILEHGIGSFVERWENISLFKSQKKLDEKTKNEIRKQRLLNSEIGLANSLKGMGTGAQASYWHELSKISVQTLLITGQLDNKFVNIAEKMAKMNELFTHVSVKNAGHAIHVEKPEIFGTIVMEFLANDFNQK